MVLISSGKRSGPGEDPDGPGCRVHIHIGEHYVSGSHDVEILTVLGSCIGACIRDPRLRIGGMNHFMLPGSAGEDGSGAGSDMRYGQVAMERLINDLLAAGARRERLEVKLFGGANMLHNGMRVGDRNVAFVRHFLAQERMTIAASDVGGTVGRRIRYQPATGQVMRLRLGSTTARTVFVKELDFSRSMAPQSIEGTVELFE